MALAKELPIRTKPSVVPSGEFAICHLSSVICHSHAARKRVRGWRFGSAAFGEWALSDHAFCGTAFTPGGTDRFQCSDPRREDWRTRHGCRSYNGVNADKGSSKRATGLVSTQLRGQCPGGFGGGSSSSFRGIESSSIWCAGGDTGGRRLARADRGSTRRPKCFLSGKSGRRRSIPARGELLALVSFSRCCRWALRFASACTTSVSLIW
jgi:hypothetical protein